MKKSNLKIHVDALNNCDEKIKKEQYDFALENQNLTFQEIVKNAVTLHLKIQLSVLENLTDILDDFDNYCNYAI